MSKRWPLYPKPYEYQFLYSWIEKLAEVYGVSYQSFCKNVLGLTPQEIGDLRTSLPEKALIILANGTNIPIDDLRWRDLNGIFKKLQQEVAKIIENNPEELLPFLTEESLNYRKIFLDI